MKNGPNPPKDDPKSDADPDDELEDDDKDDGDGQDDDKDHHKTSPESTLRVTNENYDPTSLDLLGVKREWEIDEVRVLVQYIVLEA
jgi:hypothetical protein